jgi:tRNA-modifying protein YgfZ
MGPLDAPRDESEAVAAGRAFADLSDYRKVRVSGADAEGWLNDLVTCDVASLTPGGAHRSLLLSPTGRILADFGLGLDDEGYLLLQPADQPDHIGLLLSRYILSSEVDLHDATNELALFAVLGAARELVGRPGLSPSVAGFGVDLVMPVGKTAWHVEDGLVRQDLVEVGVVTVEVQRIRAGTPRMGSDFGQDALPAEAGLEWTIDTRKGCFLGQESVAKIRNLGHPPRVIRHLRAEASVGAGTAVVAGETPVGELTSAAVDGAGTVALAMVAWAAADRPLRTVDGIDLHPVGSMD